MPIAAKFASSFLRYAAAGAAAGGAAAGAAAHNGAQGIRNAFGSGASSSSSSAASSTAQGLSGSGSGAGIGGAKYHAGRGAHSHFQSSSRALANASASGANDGSTGFDDEEELAHRRSHRGSHALALRQQISPSAQFQRRFADAFSNTKKPMLVGAQGYEETSQARPSLEITRTMSTAVISSSNSSPISTTPNRQARTQRSTHRVRSLSTASAPDLASPEGIDATELSPSSSKNTDAPPKGITIPTGPRPRKREASQQNVKNQALLDAFRDEGSAQTSRVKSAVAEEIEQGCGSLIDILRSGAHRSSLKMRVLGCVRGAQEAPPDELRLSTYNACFKLLRESHSILGAPFAAMIAVSLWKQLAASDILPNRQSYERVISCLLNADRSELFERIGLTTLPEKLPLTNADLTAQIATRPHTMSKRFYPLAWELTCAAYAFGSVQTRDDFLELAALHGDVRKCRTLLEMSRADAKDVQQHGRAHAFLMHSIVAARALAIKEGREAEGDPSQDLVKVFEQVQAGSELDLKTDTHADNLFDALIRAHFAARNPSGAVALLSQTLSTASTSPPHENGEVEGEALRLASTRISNFIIGFVHSGDVASACSWFAKHISLHSTGSGDARASLTSPCLYELAKLIVDTLKQDDAEARVADAPQTLSPLLIANDAALAVSERGFTSWSSLQQKPEILGTFSDLIVLNATAAKALIKTPESDSAGRLLDASISLIPVVSEPERLQSRDAVSDLGAGKVLEAIVQTVGSLVAQGRFTDAASLLTWTARRGPRLREGHLGAFDTQTIGKLQEAALGVLSAEGSPTVLLDCACRYIFTATFAAVADLWSNDELVKCFTDLYRRSRSELPAAWTESLTLSELKCLQEAFAAEEDRLRPADIDAFKNDGLGMLWTELLAQSPHAAALIGRVKTVAIQRYGEMGRQYADAIGGKPLNADAPSFGTGVGVESGATEDLAQSESSQDRLGSPVSTAPTSIFEHSGHEEGTNIASTSLVPPPVVAPLPVPPLPEVQMVDLDLSSRLYEALTASRAGHQREEACEVAWGDVREAIAQTGSFVDVPPLERLLDDAGRRGKLDRLWELYSIGSAVVQSIAGDQKWQLDSWCRLENAMMAASAHAGETDASSIFRHRLINSGRVPDADAYAALIANINDTTDDALVAQELFAESQRLGCVPSVYLYTATISKLARARKAELALQLFQEMQEPGRDLQPTVVTIGAAINACVRTGDIVNAERIFAKLESDIVSKTRSFRLRAPPFNTLIQYFVNVADREKALSYYGKMQRLRVQPSEHTYKLLLDAFGSLQPPMLQEMESTFNQLVMDPHAHVNGTHWAALINAYGATDADRAISVFESIARHPTTLARTSWRAGVRYKASSAMPDSVAYEALLGVLLQHGRVDLVQKYIDRMRSEQSVGLTAYVANLVIRAFSSEGTSEGLARARAVFNEMSDPPVGMAAVGNHPIGHRQHHAGAGPSEGISHEPTPAEVARASQHHLAHAMRDVQKEPSTWLELIRAEVAAGQKAEAARLTDRMAERGYPAALVMRGRELLSPMTEPDASAPQNVAA